MRKYLILFLVATALFYGCSSVPITGRKQLNLVSDDVLLSVIDLSLHHKWQTVKFAKTAIRQLITNENYRKQLENYVNGLR